MKQKDGEREKKREKNPGAKNEEGGVTINRHGSVMRKEKHRLTHKTRQVLGLE